MAKKAEMAGVAKAQMPLFRMFTLAVLAGAFIALGAVFATTVTAGAAGVLPFGVTKLLGGLVFSLGLILVVVGGAELFTGNNLIIMAWAGRRVSTRLLLQNWVVVYLGNLVGALGTAGLMLVSGQYAMGRGVVGGTALAVAQAKCDLEFLPAVALGILCNTLVCLAVWLCFSARSVGDKILAIIFPITAFVAAGFEHSVANMYFISIGLFIKAAAPAAFWQALGQGPEAYPALTWLGFIWGNLAPVTLGNILGGSVLVGLVYWSVYLRGNRAAN
ncbi:MAG: formate transporter FocA [Deltaproteobacteria bacterium]|nr:formate transporter FocA [Deltaproteobacteria bacterium]